MIKDVIRICKEVIYSQPFFGSVLLTINKKESDKVPTAGVGLNGLNIELLINKEFWENLSDNHKTGLLIHELGHVINFHLTDYKHLTDHKIANIAMDLYINQTIPSHMLPDGGCTCEVFDLPEGHDTNWYYNELIKQKNNNQETMQNLLNAIANGESTFSDSDGNEITIPEHNWDDIKNQNDATKKIIAKSILTSLNNVVKEMQSSNPGSIPGGIEAMLEALNKIEPPKFNWKAYVKRFVGVSTETWTYKTRRKKSQRFVGMPGLKEFYYSNILVAIDTSGSVNKNDLKEFQNELFHLHKTGHSINIILADTEIQAKFKFNPKEPFKINGRGGTCFQPVIDYYRENIKKYSCLMYFTDGEAATPTDVKGNILWVHGSDHEINHELPGKCIKLEL
jgi:predicted metal-dependent peptidase